MHWKEHLIPRNSDSRASGGVFSLLKGQVTRVRKENEPPVRDPESFSRYVCDLCHSSGPLSGLRQCIICGRWGCNSCWLEDYYLCKSCGGIMRLLSLPVPNAEKPPEVPGDEPVINSEDQS